MLHIVDGHIILDGRDLSTIPSATVRSRFNTISQDPFFLPGTIHSSLDPHDSAGPGGLYKALQSVGLSERVEQLGGLDAALEPGQWSAGERQLLALARAVVNKAQKPVLIVDEFTSRYISSFFLP